MIRFSNDIYSVPGYVQNTLQNTKFSIRLAYKKSDKTSKIYRVP
eukprot:SAG11_NODE_1920_length_4069_cov_3.001511_7_plen_43_part_01